MKEYKELNYFNYGACHFRLLLNEDDGAIKLEIYNKIAGIYEHVLWFDSIHEAYEYADTYSDIMGY